MIIMGDGAPQAASVGGIYMGAKQILIRLIDYYTCVSVPAVGTHAHNNTTKK